MSDNPIEPRPVIELVEQYVHKALADADRYDNSTPLDAEGVRDLHRLAAEVYTLGVRDGVMQELLLHSYAQQREITAERNRLVGGDDPR